MGFKLLPGWVGRREKSAREVGVVARGSLQGEDGAAAMGILFSLLTVACILPQAVHSDVAEGIHQGRGEVQKQNEGKN